MAGKPRDPVIRFWKKVQKSETCWLWTGATDSGGYGRFWDGQHVTGAHQFSYRLLVGPSRELDHLCRTRLCVRPNHLEPVTHRENVHRGNGWSGRNARATHCPYGHEYTVENIYVDQKLGGRACRACRALRDKRKKSCPQCGTDMDRHSRQCRACYLNEASQQGRPL